MYNSLTKDTKKFLYIQVLLSIAGAFIGIYYTIYIYKMNETVTDIIVYNMIYYIVTIIAIHVSNQVAYKKSIRLVLILGILVGISYFAMIIILRDGMTNMMPVMALMAGFELGFMAFAFNTLPYYTNDNQNMEKFISVKNIVTSFFAIIAPVITGLLISMFDGNTGYYIVFAFGLIIQVIVIFITLLWKFEVNVEKPKNVLKILANKDVAWRRYIVVSFVLGIRDVVYGFFGTVFIYEAISTYNGLDSETIIGIAGTIGAIIALGTNTIVGKKLKEKNTNKFGFLGVVMPLITFILLILYMNVIFGVVYLIVNSTMSVFFDTPNGKIMYNILDNVAESKEDFLNFMVAREWPIVLGRMVGLFTCLLVFTKVESQMTSNLIIIGIYSLILLGYFGIFKSKAVLEIRRRKENE